MDENKNNAQYLAVLMSQLTRAYKELDDLKKQLDLKIEEIKQLEKLIKGMTGEQKSE